MRGKGNRCDSFTNGIFLNNSEALGNGNNFDFYHSGPHDNYSKDVDAKLKDIHDKYNFDLQNGVKPDVANAKAKVQALQADLYN